MKVDDILATEMFDKKINALKTAMQISAKAQTLAPIANSLGDENLIEDIAEISDIAKQLCESTNI
ncbi:hypothetical protein IJ818_00505 [bacterium]|nr:hypothetical protein [bacterium]